MATMPNIPSMSTILTILSISNIITILFLSVCSATQAQSFTCDKANNTLGTCDCDNQFFVAENCTKVSIIKELQSSAQTSTLVKAGLSLVMTNPAPTQYCHTRLHLGLSTKLRIWQVPVCKMEPQSGFIMYQKLHTDPPTRPPTHPLT